MTSDPIARFQSRQATRLHKRMRLRPLGPSDSFDAAIALLQTMGRQMLGASAIPAVISTCVVAYFVEELTFALGSTNYAGDFWGQIVEFGANLLLGLGIGLPLLGAAWAIMMASVATLVGDYYRGATTTDNGVSMVVRRSLGPAIVALGLVSLTMLIPLLVPAALFVLSAIVDRLGHQDLAGAIFAFAIAASILACLLEPFVIYKRSLTVPIVVLEGKKPIEAMRRSKKLLRGSAKERGSFSLFFGSVFSSLFLACIIAIPMGMLADEARGGDLLRSLVQSENLQELLQAVLTFAPVFFAIWLVGPMMAAAVMMMYFDRRIRTEGYDIEALAQDVWRADSKNRFQL